MIDRWKRALPAALVTILLAAPALSGDGDYEPGDEHKYGVSFFGEVKEVGGLDPVQDAQIKLQLRGTMRFVIFQSDADGRFRRPGLGLDVDPEHVDVSCEKPGFRTVEVMRRRASGAKDAPVEIECLMERR